MVGLKWKREGGWGEYNWTRRKGRVMTDRMYWGSRRGLERKRDKERKRE